MDAPKRHNPEALIVNIGPLKVSATGRLAIVALVLLFLGTVAGRALGIF